MAGLVPHSDRRGGSSAGVARDGGALPTDRTACRAGVCPGNLVVVERLAGDASTAWGVPSVLAPAESQPLDAATAQRHVALLRAACPMLEEAVAASPAELRKGPQGGAETFAEPP